MKHQPGFSQAAYAPLYCPKKLWIEIAERTHFCGTHIQFLGALNVSMHIVQNMVASAVHICAHNELLWWFFSSKAFSFALQLCKILKGPNHHTITEFLPGVYVISNPYLIPYTKLWCIWQFSCAVVNTIIISSGDSCLILASLLHKSYNEMDRKDLFKKSILSGIFINRDYFSSRREGQYLFTVDIPA